MTRLLATDWLRATGFNCEFETEDGFADAGFVEHIPMFLDHHFDFPSSCESNMIADFDVLVVFGRVTGSIPEGQSKGDSKAFVAPSVTK